MLTGEKKVQKSSEVIPPWEAPVLINRAIFFLLTTNVQVTFTYICNVFPPQKMRVNLNANLKARL